MVESNKIRPNKDFTITKMSTLTNDEFCALLNKSLHTLLNILPADPLWRDNEAG